MTAITKSMPDVIASGKLRPFDPARDLRQVADLVELCFADTLDQEGHSYLRHMRAAARAPGYMRWAGMFSGSSATPPFGFVWEEDGQVIGNLTLIPYLSLKHNYYLIANVAVHPIYRRQGIARSLTEAGVNYIRRRGAQAAWLHVRAENAAAGSLYRSLGFNERASRTTWHNQPETSADRIAQPHDASLSENQMGIKIVPRRSEDWQTQRLWLRKVYPPQIAWQIQLRMRSVRPGFWGFIYRLFNEMHLRQWSAIRDGRLIGVITWQASLSYADHLWLAVNPEVDETAVAPLLSFVRKHSSPKRVLSLDYPSEHARQDIQSAGYAEHQTLVWMSLDLSASA
jgi:ribosomal protein S18 acetylase RimI-like enzyme